MVPLRGGGLSFLPGGIGGVAAKDATSDGGTAADYRSTYCCANGHKLLFLSTNHSVDPSGKVTVHALHATVSPELIEVVLMIISAALVPTVPWMTALVVEGTWG